LVGSLFISCFSSCPQEAIAIKNTEDLAEKYSYFKPIVVSQKKDEGRQDESTPEEQAKEEQLVPRDDTNETGLEKQANKEHPPSQSDLNDGSKTNNARDTKLEVDASEVTIKDAKPEAHASSTTKSPSWFGCTTPIWNNEDAMSEIEVTLQEVLECRVPKKEADTPDKTEPSRQLEADVTTVTVKEAKPEAQASATTQSLSWFGCTVPIWNTEAASPEIEITLQEILECIATKQEADTTVKNKSCRQEPIDVSAEENKARENFLICMKRHGSLVNKGISTQSEQFVKSEATLRESLTRLQYWERRRATADSSCTLK